MPGWTVIRTTVTTYAAGTAVFVVTVVLMTVQPGIPGRH
jgi:hypothetical protein